MAVRLGLCATALALLATGCTGADGSPPEAPPGPPTRQQTQTVAADELVAGVIQLRHEEGTDTIHVRVYNNGPADVEVAHVRLAGPALASDDLPVRDEDRVLEPRTFLSAPGQHSAPACDFADEPGRVKVVGPDGQVSTIGVDADGQAELDRLSGRLCGEQRVAGTADITFAPTWRTVRVDGLEALRGSIVLRRPAGGGSADPLTVTSLGASVLLRFETAAGVLPYRLGPDQQSGRIPITLVPSMRCDEHGLSQSQQTYLLGVTVAMAGHDDVRLVLTPDRRTQARGFAAIRSACGL